MLQLSQDDDSYHFYSHQSTAQHVIKQMHTPEIPSSWKARFVEVDLREMQHLIQARCHTPLPSLQFYKAIPRRQVYRCFYHKSFHAAPQA